MPRRRPSRSSSAGGGGRRGAGPGRAAGAGRPGRGAGPRGRHDRRVVGPVARPVVGTVAARGGRGPRGGAQGPAGGGRPGRAPRAAARTTARAAPDDAGGRGGGVAQGGGEGRAVGEAVGRVLGERRADDGAQVGRDPVGQLGDGVAHVRERGRDGGGGVEGTLADEALVGHDPEGVDVGGGHGGAALGLLGREVLRRAHHLAGLGQRHALGGPGDAEVGDLHPTVGRDEQVGRLHVAVHDAGGVRGADGVGGLREEAPHRVGVHRAAGPDQVRQRLAVDQLHHQVGPRHVRAVAGLRGLAEVEDRGDVGVVQRRRVVGLGLEPGPEGGVVGVLRLEQLHRDRAAERGVARAPHLAHAARRDP